MKKEIQKNILKRKEFDSYTNLFSGENNKIIEKIILVRNFTE
jgi:hypothetical protein